MEDISLHELVLNVVILAPVLETLLFQATVSALARLCKASAWQELVLMIALFALPHFFVSIQTGVTAGLVLGFYLGYVYTSLRGESFAFAYGMTVVFHGLCNSLFLVLSFIFD